jgi:hypothetical protein
MPSVYEDARARLFDELRQIVPRVLDFREDEQLVSGFIKPDEALWIRTQTSPLGGLPFLTLPEKEYRRKGSGSAIEQLHRLLRLLVRDRMWRETGGPAPSAALFRTNHVTSMLLHQHKVLPQDFVDAVWDPVDIHDGWSEAQDWRSQHHLPEVMKQSPVAQREVRRSLKALPWVAGVSLHDEIYLDAVGLCPEGALYRLTRFGPTELRMPTEASPNFRTPAEGGAIGDIVWEGYPLGQMNPILVDDLVFSGSMSVFKRSLRLMAEGEFLWEQCYFDGKAHDDQRAEFNRRIRQLFLKRARIEATIVKHLTVFE